MNIFLRYLVILLICCNYSCKKLLDEKSSSQLVIPSSQKDLQALMDDYLRINNADIACTEVSSDDYYLNQSDFNNLSEDLRAQHIWEPANIFRPGANDWAASYKIIYYTNTVLELVDNADRNGPDETSNLKGQAYYQRAKAYLALAAAFCVAFDSSTAVRDLGLPLRLTTNFNDKSVRSSLADTYNLIVSDIKNALQYLPKFSVHVMRPSKIAAHGLMSRALLYMRRYQEAGLHADSVLQVKNSLLNYNTLNATANFPVPQFNIEVVVEHRFGSAVLLNSRAKVDSLLYSSYSANDLRKIVFFKSNNNNTYGFKGSYEGGTTFFSGISVDEMYLNRAECLARAGQTKPAMDTLNALLRTRWKTNTFIPYTAANADEAVTKILQERRKELLMRGIRWMDIKRLNRENFGIGMLRKLNNTTYQMSPNDRRFALAIPEDVITLSGMEQNLR